MYLRSTPRRNKDGSEVRYLQLAHNVWDPAAKRSKVQVVYNFGREDAASREALQRLVASVARHLDPGKARAAAAEGLEFTESRPLGASSKLAAAGRASEDVLIAGLPATTDDACYRAMDRLLEVREQLEEEIFGKVSDLLGLEVDLLFFDTTSTYFETEEAGAPAGGEHGGPAGGEDAEDGRAAGFRAFGKSQRR